MCVPMRVKAYVCGGEGWGWGWWRTVRECWCPQILVRLRTCFVKLRVDSYAGWGRVYMCVCIFARPFVYACVYVLCLGVYAPARARVYVYVTVRVRV